MSVGTRAHPVARSDADAVSLVSVGRAIPYCRLRIAAEDATPLPDGQIGHIHIGGDNVTQGYYENPQANAEALTADGWLRTGDLGLVHGGALYISGRAKEIIFVNGQNYYPHDLEAIAQRADGLDLGKVVAAGARRNGAQTDELVVFVLHRGELADFLAVATQVARLINEHTGLEVAHVVPVKRIAKTTARSSGTFSKRAMSRGISTPRLPSLKGCVRRSVAPPRARATKSRRSCRPSAPPPWRANASASTTTSLSLAQAP